MDQDILALDMSGTDRGVWLRDLGDEADEVKDVFSDHTKIQVLAVRWLIPESFLVDNG